MNTRKKLCFYINLILSLAIMVIIFLFSTETGELSNDRSGSLKEALLSLLDPILPELLYNFIDEHIRQLAHFALYFALGVTVSLSVRSGFYIWNSTAKPILPYLIALIICIIYAAFDELHQYFVPGRSCRIIDVGIDSLGAFISIGLHFIITLIHKKRTSI